MNYRYHELIALAKIDYPFTFGYCVDFVPYAYVYYDEFGPPAANIISMAENDLWYEYDPTMRWVKLRPPGRPDCGGEVRFKEEADAVFYKLRYG